MRTNFLVEAVITEFTVAAFGLQEEVALIEGQVAELKGLVQQQDALNATLQQRVHSAAEAESRAKVTCLTMVSALSINQ